MVDIQIITKLRQQTGAGMVECKEAIDEAGGDFEKAVDILRKKGESKAAKKADRATNEGVIAVATQSGKTAIVSVACETDFVAINKDFIEAVNGFAKKLLELGLEEFKTWVDATIKGELVVRIGENIKLVEAKLYENEPVVGTYLHSDRKTVGVVILSAGEKSVADDLAMQVVAMSPEYVKPEDVPAEIVNKEKEIASEQLAKEGKPAQIIEKILTGKMQKFYEDICLTKQAFIKDDKKSIEEYLAEVAPGAQVLKFERLVL